MKVPSRKALDELRRLSKDKGGMIRTTEAIRQGVHPRTLYQLRESGTLERLSRGVYRFSERKPLSEPDLVTVSIRVPKGIICLVSALAFHGITTQIPHSVSLALEKGAESPRIDYPPVIVYRFSRTSLAAGIEEHEIDGVKVRVYSAEKTIADCFKFRNKIGMDIVLEALRLYRARKKFSLQRLLEYARICRAEKVMSPYLEALA
ncbi:MAG: type IV toxin-antitoxin system AbiEi family antitoxin domain-containing protein [Verrucomicrobia bacterium]|nr:type IV toxin-antitoxin system AbiEi family antitoxin domain-containing protein [Verrucomicrobiota bacterium]